MKTNLPINLSFEEISSMSSKGTLEQYILSNGYRYQDFLLFAINSANKKVKSLEEALDSLEYEVSDLSIQLDRMYEDKYEEWED